jgi:hypothetical protein
MRFLISALQWSRQLMLAIIMVLPVHALANDASAPSRAADFTLIDQHGKAFHLHYYAQRPAIVLSAHSSGSDQASAAARLLQQSAWSEQGVVLALLNPVAEDSRADLRAYSVSNNLGLPILKDAAGLVAATYELQHIGETLVIDPRRWQIVYRGPATTGTAAELHPELTATLDSLLAGQPATMRTVSLQGSPALNLTDLATDAIASYADDIAPMLLEKCADCHRPGGIAPWAMNSHAMVQGFSPMIRETILTRRMPPWHADPEIGEFTHDLSLTLAQQRQLVAWIDAGAPRGSGPDLLQDVGEIGSEWELGEPDLIVTLPAFDIPATGVLDYQFFEVKNPLDHDVWVRAVQISPGDRQVVHHAIATFGTSSGAGERIGSGESLLQPQLMTFVPGNETFIYPENTGVHVPAGSSFYAQMHYTTYGRETRDQTRIGLYFSESAPEHVLQHYSILGLELRIPAGAADHQEQAYYQFRRDSVIYALFPHAHYRGKASEFSIRYPDGTEELVLSVPNYDFNWQRYFQLKEPIEVPAGTLVIHRTTYDNSSANLSNPDPEARVRFGEQTWEEMLYGGISFRYAEPGENDFVIDEAAYMTSIVMGFMDRDMDGQVSLSEMPEQARQSLALPFTIMDREKTGGLNFEEFQQLMTQTGMMNSRSITR